MHPCFVTLRPRALRTRGEGILLQPHSRRRDFASRAVQPPLAITSTAAAAANVPRPAPYPPARWQVTTAAVLLLRPCRSATGGNSRSTVRAHQQPVQRPAMSPPASRACAALLYIALLCRADRFSPSTLSVTMRRMLYAVCPCCVTDSAAASLFVYNLPLLIGSAGAAQKGDKRVRHFGGVFTLPYRMQCPLCCVAVRAQHE